MRKLSGLILGLLLGTGTLAAQSAPKNMSLVGHIPYTDVCSDVVGYVHPSGTEYAILGHENGTSLISLANPANPVVVQELPAAPTIWHEVDVYQNYAYIVNEQGDGLRIINLTTLPGAVAYKDTIMDNMNTGHTLHIEGDRLYIYGADIDNGGVSIYSLADPWRPSRLGAWSNAYVHDAYTRGDTAYLSEIYDGVMEMVDLRNPGAPVSLGFVQTPMVFTHNTWLNDAGDVCFTTDEVDAAWIAAYDVSDPANIVEIDRFRSSLSQGQAIPHNVKVLNDFIVTAYYKDGVNIVDAARPHNLIEVGWYDTTPLSGGGFDGVWGADMYLPSGLVLAADMSEGFFVLDPTYRRACYLEGTVTDASNGQPINGATIDITSFVTESSATLGNYATGVADSGTYSVTYSKFGYISQTFSLNLDNGVLLIKDVALVPVPRMDFTINVLESGTNAPIPFADVEFVSASGTASYTMNGTGTYLDTNFIADTYTVTAGQWGWVTNQVQVTASAAVTSITIYLDKGYYDDFYFGNNWTVSSTADAGIWERGEPNGTTDFGGNFFNPDLDITTDYGDQAYVTGNGGGNVGDDDVDNGATVLTSPVMDLTTYSQPVLKVYRWFGKGGGSGAPNDTLSIRISNGTQTVTLKRISDFTSQQWRLDTFIVANYITVTGTMRAIFDCADNPQGNLVEAAIDGFRVTDAGAVAVDPGFASEGQYLRISPNPMRGQSLLEYSLGHNGTAADARVEIRDLTGRLVWTRSLNQGTGSLYLSLNVPAGMYIATLYQGDAAQRSFRLSRMD